MFDNIDRETGQLMLNTRMVEEGWQPVECEIPFINIFKKIGKVLFTLTVIAPSYDLDRVIRVTATKDVGPDSRLIGLTKPIYASELTTINSIAILALKKLDSVK